MFTEQPPSLKRPAEPTDGLDDAKRQRLTGGPRRFPPMPPPPNSFAHLFTLTEDTMLQQFDVKLLPLDIVNTVATVLLQHVDNVALEEAINAVRARYDHLQKVTQPRLVPDVPMAGPTGIDDDDDYDPEFVAPPESLVAASTEKALEELAQPAIELGPFELPKPPPLANGEAPKVAIQNVKSIDELIKSLDGAQQGNTRQKLGLNRLAASTYDRDAWVTMLVRLATRAPKGLDTEDAPEEMQAMLKREAGNENIPTIIREALFSFVTTGSQGFRAYLNVVISWLNEEWYADKILMKANSQKTALPNYDRLAVRLLRVIVQFLDARDKNILIRFLSEIPAINEDMLRELMPLVRDPERTGLCILALQYLLMMRPPVRELVLDRLETIWKEGDAQAKKATAKVLLKWRPAVLQGGGNPTVKKEDSKTESNGVESPLSETNGITPGTFDPRRRMASGTPQAVTAGNGV